ncbi:MAG: GNAT family N-acetyltransferase [Pseudomonadota bacterium]
MSTIVKDEISFARLSEIDPNDIAVHMSDPKVAEHMPLLSFKWNFEVASEFVVKKESYWARDGLGHWAFLSKGQYVGWGVLQKEDGEWDFGLVLRPDAFGLGKRISKKAIDFAIADKRIPFVTFLLPPSRKNLGALRKLGAKQVGEIEYEDAQILKFRLDTE